MKIRLIQFAPSLGQIDRNLDYHLEKIEKAISDEIELIVFPELSISGYQLKDIIYDIAIRPESKILKIFKEKSKKISIIAGIPFEDPIGIFYNCAFLFMNGDIGHIHRKVQLPTQGMFEEGMIFKHGNRFESFMIGDMRVGILICREILFPVNAYLYYLQNTDMIIGISNSPHRDMGKNGFKSHALWERLGEVYSINYHQNYIFVNRTGFEDGIGFGGGSFYSEAGKGIKNIAKYYEEDSIDIDCGKESIRISRLKSNYLRDEHPRFILKELERIVHGTD